MVLFQHYGWDDFSASWGWWSDAECSAFHNVIKDYNIIGIFHGHTHAESITEWNGIKIYDNGAAQRDPNVGEFFIVYITQNEMAVTHRYTDRWAITAKKAIAGITTGQPAEREKVDITR